jgi:hypothetical protein
MATEAIQGRAYGAAGDGLLRISLPPGTPRAARTTVQQLVEMTAILSRRCAQLQHALESRVVIEQAKGVVAARLEIPVDEAFELLRRTARNERTKLREIADEVVASRTAPQRIALPVSNLAPDADRVA